MKNRMVIALTAWNRPEYTKKVLESLEKVRKPKPIYLVAYIEPGNEEVQRLFDNVGFECEVTVNKGRRGSVDNTKAVMQRAFELSNRVVKLEDDTPLAYDALYYFSWGLKTYKDDTEIFSVCGYNRNENAVEESRHDKVFRFKWFTPWGWATWKNRWDRVVKNWPKSDKGWDKYLHHVNAQHEIRPVLSRVQNIGARDGNNCPGPQFHRTHHWTPEWAGNYEKLLVEEYTEE